MAFKPPFNTGAQVEHPKFGLGSVVTCTEEQIVIKFDEGGEKKFVLSIVLPNLKKSDRTPPSDKKRKATKKTAAATAAAATAAAAASASAAAALADEPVESLP